MLGRGLDTPGYYPLVQAVDQGIFGLIETIISMYNIRIFAGRAVRKSLTNHRKIHLYTYICLHKYAYK